MLRIQYSFYSWLLYEPWRARKATFLYETYEVGKVLKTKVFLVTNIFDFFKFHQENIFFSWEIEIGQKEIKYLSDIQRQKLAKSYALRSVFEMHFWMEVAWDLTGFIQDR